MCNVIVEIYEVFFMEVKMKKSVLIGNGINIQFGGYENYSNAAIMQRVVHNIKNGKYNELMDNEISSNELMEILNGLVDIVNAVVVGKWYKYADFHFMCSELKRIQNTYNMNSTITDIGMEDLFIALELLNNKFNDSETTREILKNFFKQIIVDGIYNEGQINKLEFYPNVKKYLSKFENVFTVNYDDNIERCMGVNSIYHLHGDFRILSSDYDRKSVKYKKNPQKYEKQIQKMILDMEHIYCNAIMSWYWLDKYAEANNSDTYYKYNVFKNIEGNLEIIGLAPRNDEHLFLAINQNTKLKSVTYYYKDENEITEVPIHIKKPVTYKNVDKLWKSLK